MNDFARSFDSYTELIEDLSWGKFFIVSGPGGSRVDFVCSWLNMHRGFHNLTREWDISDKTGATFLNYPTFLFYRPILGPIETSDRLQILRDVLLPKHRAGHKHLVLKSHAPVPMIFSLLQDDEILDKITVVAISMNDIDQDYFEMINWEFLCKTFLEEKHLSSILKTVGSYHGIKDFSIQYKNFHGLMMRFLKPHIWKFDLTKFQEYDPRTFDDYIDAKLTYKIVKYQDLVIPAGADIMTEILALEPDTIANKKWQENLPRSFSPPEVEFFGQVYSYDLIKKFQC